MKRLEKPTHVARPPVCKFCAFYEPNYSLMCKAVLSEAKEQGLKFDGEEIKDALDAGAESKTAHCLRLPPTWVTIKGAPTLAGDQETYCVQPEVSDYDCCGEFKIAVSLLMGWWDGRRKFYSA